MSIDLLSKPRINLNNLSPKAKKELTQATYAKESYFYHLFNQHQVEFNCREISLKLRENLERLLIDKKIISTPVKLENLHEHITDELKEYNFNDGVNKLSTYFYETDPTFIAVYYEFIRYIRENIVKEPFWFQATPTIRIHCPNGKNNNHYPRYHTDIGYGHPPEEFNIWLPLTEVLTGHGFRAMSFLNSTNTLQKFDYDFNDFIDKSINDKLFSNECDAHSAAVTTEFGNMIFFDSRCIHTGEPLKTHTRASIDIRILPLSQYQTMEIEYQGSGRRKILFAPGHCYHENNSDYYL